MNIDSLSPAYIGEDKIRLSLDASTPNPLAFQLVQVDVDYSAALPEGVSLPVEMLVQGPTEESYVYKIFRRTLPDTLSFSPVAAGVHLVLLRELAHNRWVGRLRVEVAGDSFAKV